MIFVLFKDGSSGRFFRNDVGMALTGEPTVFVNRKIGNSTVQVFVVPGVSVDWIEA